MLEIFFICIGIGLGIFTGLVPGLHLNTVSLLLASIAVRGDFSLALIVVSMSVSHSFFDFVPSILLGAPDSQNFLSVLPGHRLLLQGKGFLAVKLSFIGAFFGVFFSLLLSPLLVKFADSFSFILKTFIPFLLLSILALMVFSEKGIKRFYAFAVVILSGLLGFVALNSFSDSMILPLVSGFFAVSTLLWSLKQKASIPKQEVSFNSYSNSILSFSFLGSVAGSIVALLPSIGPANAAFVLRKFFGKISTKNYIVMLGGISSSNMVFSFFVLYFFQKTRTGSAVALNQILSISFTQLLLLVSVIVFVAGISWILGLIVCKKFVSSVEKFNYRKLNFFMLFLISGFVFLLSGIIGIAVMLVSCFIGIVSLSSGIKRTNSMAFLMFPTIVFYFSLFL